MPVHDWTLVEDGIFHDFHTVWTGSLRTALNDGLLPEGYYALAEQHAGRSIADVLTLHTSQPEEELPPPPTTTGGTAVAEAPPRMRHKQVFSQAALRRTLAIRHVSGHRLIAILEIVSPGNKDRPENVEQLVLKLALALNHGVHAVLIDLLPPGLHDPHGIHGVLCRRLDPPNDAYEVPAEEPLTLTSYSAGPQVEAYVEHVRVGANLPEVPLFLTSERYINVPLEATYRDAYRGVPRFWRAVLESRPEAQ
jgi:hypothetical protein